MRRLDPVQNVLRAAISLGTNTTESTKTPSLWAKIWSERDVQIMVLISLALQIFLLFTGNLRRRFRVSGLLKFLVWLAYLGSYTLAASAIGLFSQYEDKYKLRSLESFEHLHILTVPFLWPAFLLLHFGGPDTITAFSIDDNNLWMRQLINLVVQLSLAFYVFWKSFDLLDTQLLKVAVPLFVVGTIKYGERIWALQKGSRDSLNCRMNERNPRPTTTISSGVFLKSRLLKSALSSRGMLAGRGKSQLALEDSKEIEAMHAYGTVWTSEEKLEFVLMELGMIYDTLYTKAMMLQSWIISMFRCLALVAMVVAFVLFWANQHLHAHKTTNVAITYMLFIAAMFEEVYSIFMVIASPWTRACSKQGTFLCWLSRKLSCCFPSQGLPSSSMGQFNLTDYSISKKSMPKFISKVSEALGLEKHRRNFWHIKDVEDKIIIKYVVGFFDTNQDQTRKLKFGIELDGLLGELFEDTILILHVYTDLYLSRNNLSEGGDSEEMKKLVAECTKLSNYLMYLMAVYPSLLPVTSAAQDHQTEFSEWVRDNHNNMTKAEILEKYDATRQEDDMIGCPFKGRPSVESLKDLKEMWARLLIYAAGKCPMEVHARQLGDRLELLTVVGFIMMHHNIGDALLSKLKLSPPFLSARLQEPMVSNSENDSQGMGVPTEPTPHRPTCAFHFLYDNHMATSVLPLSLPGYISLNKISEQSTPRQVASRQTSFRSGGTVETETELVGTP